MDPTRWAKIETLFHAARELQEGDRAAFVTAGAGGDAELEGEVLALLAHDAAAGGFIESPAWQPEANATSTPGDRIGPYRLLRLHARGGMGEVFVAQRDDDHYQQQVAVKVIRTGFGDPLLIRRFRAERQILAGLNHPGIARLLDGGTTEDGRPYLVMEFVDGEPIDAFAQSRALSITGRMSLVAEVCTALEYAHRNLVVHRDIKPANILVTSAGRPILVDFGIAKLLADEGDMAAAQPTTAGPMMTLEYASPEQVRGRPVTTASDVYSLGVVLYRLLTGRSPYAAAPHALSELTHEICEAEPTRPSAVTGAATTGVPPSRIGSDIDAIVLKALQKDPERRYASADHFAADITRQLNGLPVLARESTWSYRAGKFLRRHRAAAAAAVIALAAAVLAVVSIATERERAVRRFNDVRELARAVVFDYHDAIEALPGSTAVRERLVRDALTYLDRLNQEARGDVSLARELALAYQKIGDVQGNAYYANLGQVGLGLGSHRKALALYETIARDAPADAGAAVDLGRAHDRVGDLLWETNDLTGARDSFASAIAVLERVSAGESPLIDRRIALAAAHEKLADVLGNPGFSNLGQTAAALEHYKRSLAIRESAAAMDAGNRAVQSALFGSYHRLGSALRVTGDPAGALVHVRKAQAIQEGIHAASPSRESLRTLAIAYSRTTDELELQQQLDEARELTMRSLAIFEDLLRTDAENARAQREVAVTLRKSARLALKVGDTATAARDYRRANAMAETNVRRDPSNGGAQRDLSVGLRGLGDVLAHRGDRSGARAHYRRALALSDALFAAAPANAQARGDAALAHAALAAVELAAGNAALAAAEYRLAVDAREALAAADTANVAARLELAHVSFALADVLTRLGLPHEAERRERYQRAVDLWTALEGSGSLPAGDRPRLARARDALTARSPSFP